MLDEMKDRLKKAQGHLDDLIEKLEDKGEAWSDDTRALWQKMKPRLQSMQSSLAEAAQSAHSQADEARLQAHLAAMDAHDQWQHLSKSVSDLTRHTAEKGAFELQHAELQAHLAVMDTRDFIERHGPEIRHNYRQARDKVEQTSHRAAQELEKSLEKLGDIWARTRH